MVPVDVLGLRVVVEVLAGEPDQRDQHCGKPAVQGPHGERRDRQGLDVFVEGCVVVLEPLVVRQVPGPRPVVDRDDQTRLAPTDTARCLDVLGRVLGLARDHHQAEPLNVHTYGQHVGGQQHVNRLGMGVFLSLLPLLLPELVFLRVEISFEQVQDLRDVNGRHPRGQLLDQRHPPSGKAPPVHVLQSGSHVVVNKPPHAPEFA